MHLVYVRPGLVDPLNGASGYDKWDRERDRGGGPGAPAQPAWPARDRETARERERQARAHQMSHANAADTDASSLFPAPIRVNNRDRVSQQIQTKLGDYRLAQTLLDDPSKSIGICAEPPSPAPCPPRRESEFKKPAHAPQNGRVHRDHRPYSYSKNDVQNSTAASAHRLPPLKINGYQPQNAIDSSQPPIESILKEMKALPNPVSSIAATPRKETENKFIFNPYTNKVQENPQLSNNDLKTPLPKTGFDNQISNSRSSVSPDVVKVDLGLSESDDEVVPATTTRLEPILSPIGSASPSSASESSPSDSDSDSSSAESAAPAVESDPPQRDSWSLKNFAPPPAHPPQHGFDAANELRHALIDGQGKPSPISELSDSEVSSPSPGRRRRSLANRVSAASSDDEQQTRQQTSSPRVGGGVKRGRPPKPRASDERPAKKKRGRPRKQAPPPAPPPAPPADHRDPPPQETKTHIFRKVFTPRKADECGGKGGKGGKGKGGKGKGQVTIIEAASVAPQSHYDRERTHEAMARVSPPQEPETVTRKREAERTLNERIQERVSLDRSEHRPDRLPPDRDRISDRISDRSLSDRSNDRLSVSDRRSTERFSSDRSMERLDRSNERLDRSSERLNLPNERLDRSSERLNLPNERLDRSNERLDRPNERLDRSSERLDRANERLDRPNERLDRSTERIDRSAERIDRSTERIDRSTERIDKNELKLERLTNEKSHDRLTDVKSEKCERISTERFVRAEADVGSGLKPGRGSERLEEASSIAACGSRRRARLLVRISLSRLRAATALALRRAPPPGAAPPPPPQTCELPVTNHERSSSTTPVYYSYFERLPSDDADDTRDHKYHLAEAKRLRAAAETEQEPLPRVMLYLESVLCFVLTGRVLETEMDTKRAFTIYRETIEYIKSIHSMPQRYRASPHSTFSKLDILSLRVQALLYLRMFKMYDREVKEYKKIVQDYQQKSDKLQERRVDSSAKDTKPAAAESASPLSPSPSPGGSSASSGYCSLAHAVPAPAHHALLQLTKYYTFLYVAHELWEQADCLCRLKTNQDLFIAVDRKCGPLTLSSTFRHLVQYVRHAISLLKNAPRE